MINNMKFQNKFKGVHYVLKIGMIVVLLCLIQIIPHPVQAAEGRDELVSEFRSQVNGLKLDSVMLTNETLVRYLLQSKSDINNALNRIQKTAEWRRANNVNLLALDDVSLIKDHLPYECTGTTEDGNPVFYVPLGKWNLRRVQRNRQNARLQAYIIQLLENSLRASLKEINPRTQQPNYQSVFIVDLQGFTLRSLLSGYGRTFATLFRTAQIYQQHYPYSIKKIYVLRAPQHTRSLLALARKFVSREARDSGDVINNIDIYSTFNIRWRQVIRSTIPKDSLPKNLRL